MSFWENKIGTACLHPQLQKSHISEFILIQKVNIYNSTNTWLFQVWQYLNNS